jgi:hypothetical protein
MRCGVVVRIRAMQCVAMKPFAPVMRMMSIVLFGINVRGVVWVCVLQQVGSVVHIIIGMQLTIIKRYGCFYGCGAVA